MQYESSPSVLVSLAAAKYKTSHHFSVETPCFQSFTNSLHISSYENSSDHVDPNSPSQTFTECANPGPSDEVPPPKMKKPSVHVTLPSLINRLLPSFNSFIHFYPSRFIKNSQDIISSWLGRFKPAPRFQFHKPSGIRIQKDPPQNNRPS